jgi:hypothetical protein
MAPQIPDRVLLDVVESEDRMLEELLDPPLPVDSWESMEKIVLLSAAESCNFKWSDVCKVVQVQCPKLKISRPDDWYSPFACKTQFELMVETDLKDLPSSVCFFFPFVL